MSIMDAAVMICPNCGTSAEVLLVQSVNAVRRPDLREQIIDGSFQAVPCPKCATELRLPPEFIYFDLRRGQWIGVYPAERLNEWESLETEARGVFDISFGAGAPDATRELFGHVVPRIAFGWPALREKLICSDLGLRDDRLELLKLEIMRNAPGAPVSDTIDLRLVGGDADTLAFEWIATTDESARANVAVPRQAYEAVLADPQPYAALGARLDGRLFIDLRRILLTEPIEEPAD